MPNERKNWGFPPWFKDRHQEKCVSHWCYHFIQAFHSCSAGIVSVIVPELLFLPAKDLTRWRLNKFFFSCFMARRDWSGDYQVCHPISREQELGSHSLWSAFIHHPKYICWARLYHSASFTVSQCWQDFQGSFYLEAGSYYYFFFVALWPSSFPLPLLNRFICVELHLFQCLKLLQSEHYWHFHYVWVDSTWLY